MGMMLTGKALEKSLTRSHKKQKFKDLLLWGIQGPGNEEHEDVGDEIEDEDEDINSLLTMFLEEGDEWDRQQEILERLRKNKAVQTRVSDWVTVTKIEGKKKVEVEKTVTRKFRQTTLWQRLEVKKQGQVGDGEVTGQVVGELVDHLIVDGDMTYCSVPKRKTKREL